MDLGCEFIMARGIAGVREVNPKVSRLHRRKLGELRRWGAGLGDTRRPCTASNEILPLYQAASALYGPISHLLSAKIWNLVAQKLPCFGADDSGNIVSGFSTQPSTVSSAQATAASGRKTR